jgi:Set1/Ash2 histone methyltransferase complex subunit ASH2
MRKSFASTSFVSYYSYPCTLPMTTIETKPDESIPADTGEVAVVAPVAAPVTKKRGKPSVSNPLDAATLAALSSALQHATSEGYLGLVSLLSAVIQDNQQQNPIIPAVDVVRQAAKKALVEQPLWVHWSKQDMAPHFKCDPARLSLSGAMRGYRMARASHGVSTSGCYYFECTILPGPSATDILQSLPPNARLGPGLREKLQAAVEWEEKHAGDPVVTATVINEENSKKRKVEEETGAKPTPIGGHVRLGWSMRTGDLQAPVGYDKWSYGIRDIEGSILHCSMRQDNWGGDSFGADDVIGCAIYFDEMDEDDEDPDERRSNNHIRFLKNGECMGQFVLSKGKREGGEAFSNIERGTYYPAVSCYMGGAVRANFGPYWICPPKRSRLPAGLKNLKPMSSLCAPPDSPDEAVNRVASIAKLFRKPEHQLALKDAVRVESEVHFQVYSDFLKNHIEEIRQARVHRGLSVTDLREVEALDSTKEA